jgi:hypothetical protein
MMSDGSGKLDMGGQEGWMGKKGGYLEFCRLAVAVDEANSYSLIVVDIVNDTLIDA